MKKGFTLIELLVVVTIIAILSAIGLSVFTNAQKKARDARRRADIVEIQNSMERAFQDSVTAVYAAPLAANFAQGSVPTDPLAGAAYSSSVANTAYRLCASLEITTASASFCTNNIQ